MTDHKAITFSFGKNWQSFVEHLSEQAIALAIQDTEAWIPTVTNRSVIDVGCGSGLSSLAFFRRGAKPIVSFDFDPRSVAATTAVRKMAGNADHWTVRHGSVLDTSFLTEYAGHFDIAYSWGVLHHTGQMWPAIRNVCGLVKPGGLLWLALYAKGPQYSQHLALKERYNAAGRVERWLMERRQIWYFMKQRLHQRQNPFTWNQRKERGMDIWHDIRDWLGGLPYEVATVREVVDFTTPLGFNLKRVSESQEGGNHIFLLERSP